MNVYTFKHIPTSAYTTLAGMFQQEFTHPNFKHLMEFLFNIHIWFWSVAHAQQEFFCRFHRPLHSQDHFFLLLTFRITLWCLNSECLLNAEI